MENTYFLISTKLILFMKEIIYLLICFIWQKRLILYIITNELPKMRHGLQQDSQAFSTNLWSYLLLNLHKFKHSEQMLQLREQ
jgi:hypothetical protein